jgi:hypothetical protein
MYNLDNLLPAEILTRTQSKVVDLELVLVGEDCNGSWPKCNVKINDIKIFEGTVVKQQIIKYLNEFVTESSISISINRYGKTESDTIINQKGDILSNQKLSIDKFKLNNIDLIKNNFIYNAEYVMDLPQKKLEYFVKHNIDTKNKDYHFYENGCWSLTMGLPILTYIINATKKLEAYETIDYQEIMLNIINKLGI